MNREIPDPLAVARSYVQQNAARLNLPPWTDQPSRLKPEPARSRLAAVAFDTLAHSPTDPDVVAAYDALKDETLAQWGHMRAAGVVTEPWTQAGQPYADSNAMREDTRGRGHLWYFPTAAGFGDDARFNDHPLYADVPSMPGVKYNDLFRAVHDYFAHSVHPHTFGPQGEIRAWAEHAKMFSPLARRAMTTETHGQNSWVNFGPHSHLPVDKRPYADQKAAILPEEHHPQRLARLKAGPNGAIANNQFHPGGQFLPKALKRIRSVAVHLARFDPEKVIPPEDLPTRAANIVGTHAPGQRLTLGELKGIENVEGLEEHHKLSPKVWQTKETGYGDDKPYEALAKHIGSFWHHVSRKRIPPGLLREFTSKKGSSKQRDFYLMHHLAQELADAHAMNPGAGATQWYGEKINELDRHLHARYASGPSDPLWGTMGPDGELVGKHDPARHHPALVLYKALIAATSSAQNPVGNLASVARAWKEAVKRARGDDPIKYIPHFNEPALEEWQAKAEKVGVDVSPPPAKDYHAAAKWFADRISAHKDLSDKESIGYSSIPARVFLSHDGPSDPRHGLMTDIGDKDTRAQRIGEMTIRDRFKLKDNRAIVRRAVKAGDGEEVDVSLPRVANGRIRPKGWSSRGEQIAVGIKRIQALVKHFDTTDSRLEAYQKAADWLLKPHSAHEFDNMNKATGGVIPKVNTKAGAEPGVAKGLLDLSFLDKREANKTAIIPGTFILGPKFGPFALNLHMNTSDPQKRAYFGDYLTADKWFSRTANRHSGTLKPGKDIREAPSAKERKVWANAVRLAAQRLNITPAELQADLWYHEQSLWRLLGGTGMESYDYAMAAKHAFGPKSEGHLALSRSGRVARALGDLGRRRARVGALTPLPTLVSALTQAIRTARASEGPQKLSLWDRDTHNALVRAHGEAPEEATPLDALADLQQERGESGVHLLHAAAKWRREGGPVALAYHFHWQPLHGGRVLLYHKDTPSTVPDVSHAINPYIPGDIPEELIGSAPPVALHVRHFATGVSPDSRLTDYAVPVYSRKHLRELLSDIPRAHARTLARAVAPYLPVDRPQHLARPGEEPKRLVFASHYTGSGLDHAGAYREAANPTYAAIQAQARALPGVQHVQPAYGVWTTGAEPCIVAHLGPDGDVERVAATLGLAHNQLMTLGFDGSKPGTDVLESFHTSESDPATIAAVLARMGIDQSTVTPSPHGGHTVYVVNKSSSEARAILGGSAPSRSVGHAYWPGHPTDRDMAAKDFRRILSGS